ncbi:hypothetical protein HYC85_005611 [Camellia sinensis]|uniref:AMP-activated protein kinase glycogen-binding domain-containing protein n=1 Tax=Camellia sinensis TaxID=4442 RepID=A0A7J7I1T3_CAMSI|nr:hypothetical protein HYC85_005611 [Camellia sinensis]
MKAAKGKGAAIRVPKEALKPVDDRKVGKRKAATKANNGGKSQAKNRTPFITIEIDEQAELLPDGTLLVGGQAIAVIYFRAGYAPTDYPSEPAPRRYNKSLQNPMFLRATKKAQEEASEHYKFFVDGEWRHDEHQPFVSGNYGVVNSVFLAREPDG